MTKAMTKALDQLVDLQLERDDARPLYEQLREALADQIAAGALAAGQRLPSTRDLAAQLAVNRTTIVEAYRRLEGDGLVEQRLGSGTYVRATGGPSNSSAATPADEAGAASRAVLAYERSRSTSELPPAPEGAIDMATIAPDREGLPADEVGECIQRVLSERGGEALGYGPPAGDARLRELLAERLTRRGLATDPAGILVVGGAQQGLDLVFRATLDPNDVVVTESPTYHYALDLLSFHRADVAAVPVVPADAPGMSRVDFDRLDEILTRRRPVALYTMPTFQNPTGLTLDLASRRRLAASCAAAGVLLVEDDYEADLRYAGDPSPPVAALPEAGDTAYVGTLSKALFPGLRVGWIVASPDVLARIARVKRLSDLSGPLLLQATAAELIASGTYDRHLERVVSDNAARMESLHRELTQRLPPGCPVTAPLGGHATWVGLPSGVSGSRVAERAAAHGVIVSPGEPFLPDPVAAGRSAFATGVRLSIARVGRPRVEEAAVRLLRAIEEVIEETTPHPAGAGDDLDAPVRV